MQRKSDEPVELDYASPGVRRPRRYVRASVVIPTTLLVAPAHFAALIVSSFLGYSCCGSSASTSASTFVRVLGFPVGLVGRFLDVGVGGAWLLIGLNSLAWGIVIGTALSFLMSVMGRRGGGR